MDARKRENKARRRVIELYPLPADVDRQAVQFYSRRSYIGVSELTAFVRHHYTNYEELVEQYEDDGMSNAYDIIRCRVDLTINAALHAWLASCPIKADVHPPTTPAGVVLASAIFR